MFVSTKCDNRSNVVTIVRSSLCSQSKSSSRFLTALNHTPTAWQSTFRPAHNIIPCIHKCIHIQLFHQGTFRAVARQWNSCSMAQNPPNSQIFSAVIVTAVYIPPQANQNNKLSLNKLYKAINKQETLHPAATFLVSGDFNSTSLRHAMAHFHQHVSNATRGESPRPLLFYP